MREPRTFLFITPSYTPFIGGAQILQQNIAQRLVADGHTVTVLTSNARQPGDFWKPPQGPASPLPGQETIEGVVVKRLSLAYPPLSPTTFGILRRAGHWLHRSGLPTKIQRPLLRRLARWMPRLPGLEETLAQLVSQVDLVQATDSSWDGLFLAAADACQQCGKSFVAVPLMHLGNSQVRAHFQMAHQVDVYRQAAAILALSQREAAAFASLGVAPGRIHRIPMGVEPNPIPLQKLESPAFQLEHKLTGPIVAFVGANTYDKGAFTLAQAVGQLNLAGRTVNLVCAGTQGEELAAFLRKRTPEIQAASRGRVHLLGPVDEQTKHRLLAASSVLALPSQVDTFGRVLLEAWLHGKPVVGARAGGIPEVIEEGRSGLLVPFGDAAALAEAIAWLLDHPAEAARMGARGRETTLARWTWPAVYDRVWSIYESCLAA